MKKKLPYQVLLLIIIYIPNGCFLQTVNPIVGQCDTISINAKSPNELLMSSFIDEVTYIPLETNQNSLLSAVDKLYVYENEIYILDKKQGAIVVFSENGKFKRKINRIGKGPGEYINISDFSIDTSNGLLLISDTNTRKLHLYQTNGEFYKTYNSKTLNSFCELYDKRVISYSDNNIYSEKYNLHVVDLESEKKIDYLPIDVDLKDFQTRTGGQFMKNHMGQILFKEALGYNIYKFDSSGIKNYFFIDFGEYNLPDSYFKGELDFNDLVYSLNDGKYAVYPTIFMETSEIIFFRYQFGDYRYVVYDKLSEKLDHGYVIDDINDLFFVSPICINNNELYSTIEPTHILSTLNHLKTNSAFKQRWLKIKNNETNSVLFNIIANDNPIIIKYKL
ncbi:MAG: 6-bladed beta-propeller [Alphaproteobacteria bacterium]|nr:6-bladed beta-propeller [Alphaproteobacteria bacterium]